MSLAEVEVATRIRQKYLAAIESDDWHLLPGEVVGRGFLRNYSDYLGLEPHEVVDRRRAVTDPGLVAALSTTSSGATLPPERQVDYRPKEVELKDDVDGIQRGEIKLTPILSIIAVAALVALAWLATTRLRQPIAGAYEGAQTQVARVSGRDAPIGDAGLDRHREHRECGRRQMQSAPQSADVGDAGDAAGSPPAGGAPAAGSEAPAGGSGAEVPAAVIVLPTNTATLPAPTDTPIVEVPTATPEPPTPEPPTPEPPTPTFTPEPPTPEPPTPEPELPTDTPAPEPPAVLAAACADGRAAIVSPGMNQVVSGVLTLSGTANHGNLDYYKLEFAPGANAAGGFVYFDGQSNVVDGGALGSIDTRNLPNGEYTLRVHGGGPDGQLPAAVRCDDNRTELTRRPG